MSEILYQCRATIRNGKSQPINVEEFRVWPGDLQMLWGPAGELEPGQRSAPTQLFNYYDDKDVRFLVKYRDLHTGNRFWAEAVPEFGEDSNNTTIDVTVEERLKVFHGKEGHEKKDDDWKPL